MIKLAWIGIGLGTTSLITNGYLLYRVRRADTLMDEIVESKVSDIEINIPEHMIESAVNKSVEIRASRAISKVSNEVARSAKYEMKQAVDKTIARSKDDVKSSVTSELRKQLNNLDISDMRREVKEEAKKKALAKFDSSLSDILDDFNSNLANVKKIYSSISDSVSSK